MSRPLFSRFLSLNGDGVTLNANGDYSGAAVKFVYNNDPGKLFQITSLNVLLRVTGGSFDSGGYGNTTALTNGITFNLETIGGTVPLNTSFPIFTNGDWLLYTRDMNVRDFGSGDQYLQIRSEHGLDGYYYLNEIITGISVTLNDDFTGLIQHIFSVNGFRLNEGAPNAQYILND